MIKYLFSIVIVVFMFSCKSKIVSYSDYPTYQGNDLGISYSPQAVVFKVWSPTAEKMKLSLYDSTANILIDTFLMEKKEDGVWAYTLQGDRKGLFYTYSAFINGNWGDEVTDPYAKAVAINGKKAAIIDLKETNPEGWGNDKSPAFGEMTEAIIYELHIRDASIATNSGIKNKGKFLGLTETSTKNKEGLSTGIDHIKEMGVTHVHLLPFYDFNSIDETLEKTNYNWGYDPLNYNVPEGSYATDANNPVVRIKEFKQLVKTFHENDLRVVMDVVYNHTALTERSNFNQLVPGYYYRQDAKGGFSDAAACGNETASERAMFRKFMLESMKYWVEEYHIDGFRVDLMGIHDIETMNLISAELHKIRPDILLYGEGWAAKESPLSEDQRALKKNAAQLNKIAVFSDDFRDGVKGHVFNFEEPGFVSGNKAATESVKFGIVASCPHPQIDYSKVNYSDKPYAIHPYQTVTYVSCHDNHTLWDKLKIANPTATEAQRKEMHKLALTTVLTSQGITFLHAGSEFLRHKQGVENSFESPDSINAIDWSWKSKNKEVVDYIKTLIKMRKEHPAFRMMKGDDIAKHIQFTTSPDGVITYIINGEAIGDSWKKILVVLNGNNEDVKVHLPEGEWVLFVENNQKTTTTLSVSGEKEIKANTASILYRH